jgi:N-acetylglucosaminyl-diphospho-decaprenol L-rhamnosyltransferase
MRDRIGPMDEGYFLYSEDIDYCWRARRAGFRVIHEPRARAVHFRGGSGPVKSLAAAKARLPAYFYASRSRLFYKLHGRGGLLAANLLWYLGAAIGWAKRRLKRERAGRVAHEETDIWINFLDPLGDSRGPRS